MKKVSILGASGMLGSAILDVFVQDGGFDVTATVRDEKLIRDLSKRYPAVTFRVLDAENAHADQISEVLENHDYAINAIGIIKPYIRDNNPQETERAVRVNAHFPHILSRAAEKTKTRILQIATDCTFSGAKGAYTEKDVHDALDHYGKSKSMGEVPADNMHHLRVSIIGPEPKAHVSLLDWFLSQEKGATVNGYTNHHWNGITTIHYGKLCLAIIKEKLTLPQLQHVVPSGKITKADLLAAFAKAYKREDITINPGEAEKIIDRTLSTEQEEINRQIWKAAGYDVAPTVEQMVDEMAIYTFVPEN